MTPRKTFLLLCAAAFVCVAGATRAQEAHNATIAIRDHRFVPPELKVPANKKILLKVVNEDSTSEEFESKMFKAEKVIAGKSEGIIRISPLAPGRYEFFGEYHDDTAKGALIAE